MKTSLLNSFSGDKRGATAIVFGVAILAVMMAAGSAVDYGRYASARADLQTALDAAAVTTARMRADGITDKAVLAEDARAAFDANLSNSDYSATVTDFTFDVVGVTEVKTVVSASLTMPTTIMGIAGQKEMKLGANAEALARTIKYMDFSLLLDVSQSMGLMATTAGMDQMKKLTGCAFGCHAPEPGKSYTNYDVAVKNGIPMRIDIVRLATDELIAKALEDRAVADQYAFALATMNAKYADLIGLTTDLDAVSAATDGIEMGPTAYVSNNAESDFAKALPIFTGKFTGQGDGTSRGKAEKVAFIVTDAVQDINPSHKTSPFDPKLCDDLKKKGIKVAVLYTRYLEMPYNSSYNKLVAPFQKKLAPNMKACASPGLYWEASDEAEIRNAFDEFFQTLVTTPRLAS